MVARVHELSITPYVPSGHNSYSFVPGFRVFMALDKAYRWRQRSFPSPNTCWVTVSNFQFCTSGASLQDCWRSTDFVCFIVSRKDGTREVRWVNPVALICRKGQLNRGLIYASNNGGWMNYYKRVTWLTELMTNNAQCGAERRYPG